MILNHMICPGCGHDFQTDASYASCPACKRIFYASESHTVEKNRKPQKTTETVTYRYISWRPR
jgi:predicted amidophosphoribosyltransferase